MGALVNHDSLKSIFDSLDSGQINPATNTQIRVLIIDNNIIFREKLGSLLETKGFLLLGKINHEHVKKQFEESVPAVVIVAFKSTKPATLETIRFLNSNFPAIKLIVYSFFQPAFPEEIKYDHLFIQTTDDLSTMDIIIQGLFQKNNK